MGSEVFSSFEQAILSRIEEKRKSKAATLADKSESMENRGKLLVDATVAEQAIRYPTDLNLLNEAREISENLIDELYHLSDLKKKPRTYRRQARKRYLALAKNRDPGNKLRRKGIREQLQYFRRNFAISKRFSITLAAGLYRYLQGNSDATGSSSICMVSRTACTKIASGVAMIELSVSINRRYALLFVARQVTKSSLVQS